MNVTVIGSGYVGLSTAIALAASGHQVYIVDIDEKKINLLTQGKAPFFEEGLEKALITLSENLSFTTSYSVGLRKSEAVIITVGTPSTVTGGANLSYLYDAIHAIVEVGKRRLVVIKSTVPVGTSVMLQKEFGHLIDFVSAPEFLRQGNALQDSLRPDRIVFGFNNPENLDILYKLYSSIINQLHNDFSFVNLVDKEFIPVFACDTTSAELAKYASNAFLATKISFANEISNLCEVVGANIDDVMAVVGADPRIGPQFLRSGIGYGGSCFPKDTQALGQLSDYNGYHFRLLSATIEVNRTQKFRVVDKLKKLLINLRGRQIAVLGLTFKPGTDDMREALSVEIISELLSNGAILHVHDPMITDIKLYVNHQNCFIHSEPLEALQNSDAALLVTEWPIYLDINWEEVYSIMASPYIIDGRNFLDKSKLKKIGFVYKGMGR